MEVNVLGEDVLVAENASELKVGVCDGPVGVREANQCLLDGKRKGFSPNNGWVCRCSRTRMGRRQPDTTHARAGGVASTHVLGLGRNHFCNASGTDTQAVGEGLKVGQLVVDGGRESDSVAVLEA